MIKESPDNRWPGSLLLPDYMTFPQLFRWETAMNAARKVAVDATPTEERVTSDFYLKLLPAATSLVSEWHLAGLPEKVDESNFPASVKLMSWLIDCVTALYTQTNEISPN